MSSTSCQKTLHRPLLSGYYHGRNCASTMVGPRFQSIPHQFASLLTHQQCNYNRRRNLELLDMTVHLVEPPASSITAVAGADKGKTSPAHQRRWSTPSACSHPPPAQALLDRKSASCSGNLHCCGHQPASFVSTPIAESSTGKCMICQEEGPMAFVCNEQHACCHECMTTYIRTRLQTHEIYPLPCPGYRCPEHVPDAEVLLTDIPELLDCFIRVRALQQDPSARPCPNCDNLVVGGSEGQPDMQCHACSFEFCFVHETAHAGRACGQSKHQSCLRTKLWKCLYTKACPKCHIRISKNGGCPHMVCTRCRAEFCWHCRRIWSTCYTFRGRCFPYPWALTTALIIGLPLVAVAAVGGSLVIGSMYTKAKIEAATYERRARSQRKRAWTRLTSNGAPEIIHLHRLD